MKQIKYIYIVAFTLLFVLTGCVKDLDVKPIDPDAQVANKVFSNLDDYKSSLAKVYASYAVGGQAGGGGGADKQDILGLDENFSIYTRLYWELQQLPTDEAIIAWEGDATILNFHWQTWAPNDAFISTMYSRIFLSISYANEFIRIAEEAIDEYGDQMRKLQAEARYLRALSYWHAIDMFGNPSFVTEKDLPGAFLPEQISRKDLFTYVEGELKEIIDILPDGGKNAEYAVANKAAALMLLAKLYLNAEVYINEKKYNECIAQLEEIFKFDYAIDPNYNQIFAADNHKSPEMIFPIAFDGINTQLNGGTTFLIHASRGAKMPLHGVDGGWLGIRTSKEIPALFGLNESDFAGAVTPLPSNGDVRGNLFYFDAADGWQWEVEDVTQFSQGIGVTKYRNVTVEGKPAPNADPTFASTDFPMFRLADAYLMYAECVVRGGTDGNIAEALNKVNEIRINRKASQITQGELTLDWILDERARELYWEGHRRTDLIRFNRFTENGIWTWKGNIPSGKTTEKFRDLYPIPSNDIASNPNLKQNNGYN